MPAQSVTGTGYGGVEKINRSVEDLIGIKNLTGDQVFDVVNNKIVFKINNNFNINVVEFSENDLVNNEFIYSVNRNFVVGVSIYDNINEIILPDSIQMSGNNIIINLNSFSPLTGNYKLVYIG